MSSLGFEQKLWAAADKLRSNMDASEYKHVVLGLIFLKYVSDSFIEVYEKLTEDKDSDPEDIDEYLARRVFWVPRKARWAYLQANAKKPEIGKILDNAMDSIEQANSSLNGVLPKNYARPGLNKQRLGELIDLIGTIGLGDKENRSKDILGRVYEYFLGQFASAEGKKGGQFYTPQCIVKLLVEVLEPYQGRIFDPCCGSGGMFVQSEKFVEKHGGKVGDISVYGQESNQTTWNLCKMNLAIQRIDSNIKWGDAFHDDQHKDLRVDFLLANPPFNDSDWGGELLQNDVRWKFGVPPKNNANFAWVQHFIHHLNSVGVAGFVLANGSMSSNTSNEGEIRKKIIKADVVDCMVALPPQLFYNTSIPACLWFITKNKTKFRNRRGEILFIDARKMGVMITRRHRELTEDEIKKISGTYHNWREGKGYRDVAGFCKSAKLEEVEKHNFILTPGRYVGVKKEKEDEIPFEDKINRLNGELDRLFIEFDGLKISIKKDLGVISKSRSKTEFKDTEVGLVPEDWEETRVGSRCVIKTSKTNSQDAVIGGKYPLFDRSLLVKSSNRYLFDGDAVIIPGEGKDFIARYYSGKFDLHQRAYAILSLDQKVDMKFIYYWILKNKIYLSNIAVGSTVKSLRLNHLENFPLSIPTSLKEQKAISKILFDLDSTIELSRQMNMVLGTIGQIIFKRWFVDFEFPNDAGKPYKSSGGEMVDSELGEIPKSWVVGFLGDGVLTRLVKVGVDYFSDEKIYLATADIEGTSIKNTSTKITYENRALRANMQPKPNTVWFAKMKDSKKLLFFDDYMEFELNNYVLSTGFAGLETLNNSLYYLWNFINNDNFDVVKNNLCNGTTMQAINNSNINNIKIIIPNNKTLKKFNLEVKLLYKQIYNNFRITQSLQQIKDLILPKLMSGRVRVGS